MFLNFYSKMKIVLEKVDQMVLLFIIYLVHLFNKIGLFL